MKKISRISTSTIFAACAAAVMMCATLTVHSAEQKATASKTKRVAKSKAPPPPPAPLPALGADEMAIAPRVETGKIKCELGSDVTVTADAKDPGYFDLETRGKKYKMAPVVSRVGAIRLEEVRGGDGMWLQLSNKSMLMRSGSRVADECMSPSQSQVAEGMKNNPQPSVLDAPAAK